MGGVSRTIRRVVKKAAAPIAKIAKEVPVVGNVVEAVEKQVSPPKDVVRTPGFAAETGMAPRVKSGVFSGGPAEKAAATEAAATATPKAATAAGATAAETPSARRRRGRGRVTGSRGVMGAAPVERKSLLGG